MNRKIRLPRSLAVVLGMFLLAWSSRPAFSRWIFPLATLRLGGTYAFFALMEEQRLLEKDGIRPAFVYIGGPQISQALIAGDIRMAVLGAASPVRAAAHGAEIRFIGGVTDKENITVVTDPKITKPTELKGTRMAIDRLGTIATSARAKCWRCSGSNRRRMSSCFRLAVKQRASPR